MQADSLESIEVVGLGRYIWWGKSTMELEKKDDD
jgi:hypothetical protein